MARRHERDRRRRRRAIRRAGPAALKFAHPVEIQNRDGSLATRPYRRSIESAYAVPGVTTLFAPARGERRQTVREASWSRGVVESCRKESQKVP